MDMNLALHRETRHELGLHRKEIYKNLALQTTERENKNELGLAQTEEIHESTQSTCLDGTIG